jgi:Tfp pilus assembly protein PilN
MSDNRRIWKHLAWVTAALFAAGAFARWELLRATERQLAENARLESEVAALWDEMRDVKGQRDLLVVILSKRQIVERIAGNTSPAAAVLSELSRIPRSLVLARVRFEGLRLRVDGRAGSADQIGAMRGQLEKSGLFGSIGEVVIKPDGARPGISFELAADLHSVREIGLERSAGP